MFRIKWLQPSVLYFLLSIIVLSSLLYIERVFFAEKDKTAVIVIAPDNDSTLENTVSSFQQTVNISNHLQLILDDMIASAKTLDRIYTRKDYQALDEDEKVLLASLLSKDLYVKHQYEQVKTLLDTVTFKNRVLHDVQFLYAYSLSKTNLRDEAIQQYRLLSTQNQRSQSTFLNLGLLLQKSGQCDQAIPIFTRAISISSGNKKAKALSGSAKCHYRTGLFKESVHLFTKSIEYRPNSAKTWIMLANAMAAANHPLPRIINTFDKGIALDKQNYKSYLQKARFLLANYDYPGVIETLDAASKISGNAQLFELKTWAYLELGKRNLARKELKKMEKKISSKRLKQKSELILLYLNKKYSDLIEKLKKRKRLSDDMIYLKGLTYRRLSFYKSAFKTFKELEDKLDFSWRVRVQQARMTRSRKDYSQAIEQFEQLLKHNERAAFLWFEAALVHERQSAPLQGLNKIEIAIKLSPKKLTYQLVKARLLDQSGKIDVAIETLETLLAVKTRYVRALKLLAEILTKTDDFERLIGIYQQLLAINPGDYDSMLTLARTFKKSKNPAMARTTLQTLLSEKSEHLQARYLLAEVLYADAMYSQSLLELNKLLKLDASHSEAQLLRKKILLKTGKNNEATHS